MALYAIALTELLLLIVLGAVILLSIVSAQGSSGKSPDGDL